MSLVSIEEKQQDENEIQTTYEVYDIMDKDFGYNPSGDGGLVFINQEYMRHQRQIIWEFMKTVGKHLFTGNIFKISMPVGLCEGRSFLERIPDQWCFLPDFMGKAAAAKDPIERLKYVMAFCISGLHMTVRMDKPFNPILGETFQGDYNDGTQVFLEQISHHPPVSSWLVHGPKNSYVFQGCGEPLAKFGTNMMIVGMNAHNEIDFEDGTKIMFQFPKFRINGMIMGERSVEYFGPWVFYDATHELVGRIEFNDEAYKKGFFSSRRVTPASDSFEGYVAKGTAIIKDQTSESYLADAEITIDEQICKVNGSWIDYIAFDDTKYWDRNKVGRPETVHAPKRLLPSDSRFRSDSRAVRNGNWPLAETEKAKLEEIQRRDRKLREAMNGKRHKKSSVASSVRSSNEVAEEE